MLERWTIFRNYTHFFYHFLQICSFNYSAFRSGENILDLSGNFHLKYLMIKYLCYFVYLNNYFPLLFNQLTKTIISNMYLTKNYPFALCGRILFCSFSNYSLSIIICCGREGKLFNRILSLLASFFWLNLLKFFVLTPSNNEFL